MDRKNFRLLVAVPQFNVPSPPWYDQRFILSFAADCSGRSQLYLFYNSIHYSSNLNLYIAEFQLVRCILFYYIYLIRRRPSGIFPTQQVNILCRWASFSSSATRGPTKRPSTSSRIPTCQGLWSPDSTDSCTFHCPKWWVIYDDGTPSSIIYDTDSTQHSISLPFFHNLFVGWLFRF
jgi:hypothetical protein